MPNIPASGSPDPMLPSERRAYEREYKEGADLFQRALAEHAKTENIYKKEEFREVMDKALLVLNETAKELKEKDLALQNKIIAEDYKKYQENPSPATEKALNTDLEQARTRF